MTTRTTKPNKHPDTNDTKVNQALIDLLDSWLAVDDAGAREQRETMQYLRKALDEHRLPGYKLFP
jgi:hypothetical protein